MRTRTAVTAVLLLSAACGEQPSAPLAPDADFGRERAGPGAVSAVSYNVYVGADIEALLEESPLPLPVRVAQIFAEVQATDFSERAAAIAEQIGTFQPHLIGLNEISLYRVQSPGDVLLGNLTPNAGTTVLDFLAILQNARAPSLAARFRLRGSLASKFGAEAPERGPCGVARLEPVWDFCSVWLAWRRPPDETDIGDVGPEAIPALGLVFGGIGAGLGAAIGAHHWVPIYQGTPDQCWRREPIALQLGLFPTGASLAAAVRF